MTDESLNETQQLPAVCEVKYTKVEPRPWKWTKIRRQAAKLVRLGWSDVQIAKKLGKHRCTIAEWRDRPEFMGFVVKQARNYVDTKRFRRVHETGALTDKLYSKACSLIEHLDDPETLVTKEDVALLKTFLQEYRQFREQERSDFGDNIKRVEGALHLQVHEAPEALVSTTAQSFKKLLEEHAAKLPERVLAGHSAQEILIEATRMLARSTGLIDDLAQEDAAVEMADAQVRQAAKL